jgi:tetratricopeptide (TPR) repeat protein
LVNDFAWLVFALRRSSRLHPWWQAASGVIFCCLLGTQYGCSTIGSTARIFKFWGGDDSTQNVDVSNHKQLTSALEITREKMTLSPAEPYWPYRMAELCDAADSTGQAVSYLQAALTTDAGYAPAAALLSKIYYRRGQYEDAVTLLDGFLAANPGAPDAIRAALALHLEALGNVEQAEAVLDQCDSNSREVRATRTYVSLRGEQIGTALQSAKQAVDDDPRSAANHNNYGIALLHAGQPIEAKQEFLDALELNDRLPGALYNMAILEAFYLFDEDAGRQWFERYKKYSSDDPDNLASLFGTDVSKHQKVERPD